LSDEIDNLLVVILICESMNAYSNRDDLGAVAPAAYHFTSWQERKQDIVLTTSIDVHFIKLAQTSQGFDSSSITHLFLQPGPLTPSQAWIVP
jgi:hypothetical protein